MEFHQLRYFIAAAEELNISRAAQRVHVSQPALSRQIALLEDELGLLLFERIRKRIHLTPAGEFFLGKARQLIADAQQATHEVRDQFGVVRQTIRLGFIGTFLDDLVTPVVREFQQRHPRTRVALFDLVPTEQLRRLRESQLDIGILANIDDKDRQAFDTHSLSSHRIDAVLPTDHPLADRPSILLKELMDESWVSLSNAQFPGRREFLTETCGKAGFKPRITSEEESLPLMLAAIATGHGVGLLPRHAAKIPHAGCVFVPFRSPQVSTRLLAVRRKTPANQPIDCRLALLAERAATI